MTPDVAVWIQFAPTSRRGRVILTLLHLHRGGLTRHAICRAAEHWSPHTVRRLLGQMQQRNLIERIRGPRQQQRSQPGSYRILPPSKWAIDPADRDVAAKIIKRVRKQRARRRHEVVHEEARDLAVTLHTLTDTTVPRHAADPVWRRWCETFHDLIEGGQHPLTIEAVVVHASSLPLWAAIVDAGPEADRALQDEYDAALADWRNQRRSRWSYLT